MLTVRRTTVIRYFAMCTGLAILIAVGRYLDVNPTAIALGFLIAVLFVFWLIMSKPACLADETASLGPRLEWTCLPR